MFINSLPLFFTHIKLISATEALVMLMGLFVVILITSPAIESERRPTEANYLYSAWIGAIALRSAFWPFFLLLNGLLYSIDLLAITGQFTVSSWDDIHFILLFPIFWWTISVWHCSANTDFRLWAASARMVTVCVYFEYALKLYIRIYFPRIFFNCEDLLLDYGSCF